MMNSCALLDNSKHSLTFFDLGDVLEYACGLDCRRGRLDIAGDDPTQVRDVTVDLQRKIQESSSDDDRIDTTVCVSTTKSLKDPIRLCQATVLFPKEERESFDISDVGITFRFCERSNRLVIESISKERGWFTSKGCAIREGDIVVCINEVRVRPTLSADDANSILEDVISSPSSSQLSITTVATYVTRWDRIRKSAVAAGGGTLVATGSVLMATPLHPL